jgi:hypothetical protein
MNRTEIRTQRIFTLPEGAQVRRQNCYISSPLRVPRRRDIPRMPHLGEEPQESQMKYLDKKAVSRTENH